jgi:plasmid stability protein
MADPLMRGLDEEVARTLGTCAPARGSSVGPEHRTILQEAVTKPRRRSLAEVLVSMPDVGADADFERVQ